MFELLVRNIVTHRRVEVTKHVKRCGCVLKHSEKGWLPFDGEDVSPSLCEPDSASLHLWSAVNLPDMVKPVIHGEETSECTCEAARGGWGERASKDWQHVPGDPGRCGIGGVSISQDSLGINNLRVCWPRKSEWPIVAMKQSNVCGAKGPYFSDVSIDERRSA